MESRVDVIGIGADEIVPGHACTEVSLYSPDLDLLAYMLQDLRSMIRAHDAGKVEVVAHEPKFWEVHGLRRRTVVCEPDRIRESDRVHVVGFFAARREQIDYVSLDELELGLLLEFRNFPGILSYSSIELANDFWANLVIHRVPEDTDAWRINAPHTLAIEMSPKLYSSIRIHNGHLDGGVAGNQAIAIDQTKYWDYDCDPVWQALRSFDPALERVRRQTTSASVEP